MQFIDLNSSTARVRGNIQTRMNRIIDNSQFIMGPDVIELEQKLAKYTGAKHCISCANGTDALKLALMALNIGPGDIVFTTAFSFFATAEVIPLVGATPYFVDIDKHTFNLCSQSLENGIRQCKAQNLGTPKAVIAVDIFGLPADYDGIKQICDDETMYLVADAAQSFGGSYKGRKVGALADITTTSFFPAKPLGCFGDGGAIFTQDDNVAEIINSLRVHGKGEHKYDNVRVGLNSRLDTLQAAVLCEKLTMLDEEIDCRRKNVAFYKSNLNSSYRFQLEHSDATSAIAQCTIVNTEIKREDISKALVKNNIPFQIYYKTPIANSVAMKDYPKEPIPNAELVCDSVFSIPSHAYLLESEKEKIVNTLLDVI